MQRMLSQPRAVLLQLDLGRAAHDLQFRPIVEIARLRALEPDHFAVFLGHKLPTSAEGFALPPRNQKPAEANPLAGEGIIKGVSRYARIFVTTPDPTVLPPSRTAKRSFSSMAIG